jgi:hypothetical protein
MLQWIAPAGIYLVLPASGLAHYLVVRRRMDRRLARFAFWCYVAYGGLLQVVLTTFFWYWSGMASLGFASLMLIFGPSLPIGAARLARRGPESQRNDIFVILGVVFPIVLVVSVWIIALATR